MIGDHYDDSMSQADAPAAAAPRRTLPRNVKILGFASLINDIASEMIFPLLPSFLLTLSGGNAGWLGAIEGTADSVASFLKLWSGGRSDQAGKRKGFVVFGYSLAALARPLVGFIAAPWQLLLVRVADRVGKGVRTSPRDALIADSTEPHIRGRAFGFDRAMDHLGAALGPLLATGFLLLWPDRLRTLFLLALVPGVLVVGLLALGLRETATPAPPKERLKLTLRPFDRNFRRYLLALFVFTLGNSSDAFLLLRAKDLGVHEALLPVLWCAFHVVKSTGNVVLGRGVDRFGPRLFLNLGWLVYGVVYLAFGLATEVWQVWTCFAGYAIFYGLSEPAEKAFVAQLAGAERKGLAYGWYNFALGVATLPASLLFGALYQNVGALAAFGTGAGLAVTAALLLMGVRDREGARSASEEVSR